MLYETNATMMELHAHVKVIDYAILGARTHESPKNDGKLYVSAETRAAADAIIKRLSKEIPDLKLIMD